MGIENPINGLLTFDPVQSFKNTGNHSHLKLAVTTLYFDLCIRQGGGEHLVYFCTRYCHFFYLQTGCPGMQLDSAVTLQCKLYSA